VIEVSVTPCWVAPFASPVPQGVSSVPKLDEVDFAVVLVLPSDESDRPPPQAAAKMLSTATSATTNTALRVRRLGRLSTDAVPLPLGTDFPFVDDWNPDKRRMVHSVQQAEPGLRRTRTNAGWVITTPRCRHRSGERERRYCPSSEVTSVMP
jgi:hypothetical protein